MQKPHKEKETCSDSKKKRGKTVKFDDEMQEVNTMVSNDAPIPRKKKGKNKAKNPKSENDTAVSSEEGSTYVIDRLNLDEPAKDSESDSELEK